MLAPRQKLWSAPAPVVDAALRLLQLTPADHVVDYGCGDGIAVIRAALLYGCSATGVEIHEERAEGARQRAAEAGVADRVTIVTGNALECPTPLPAVTCAYLYLIDHGLKAILPLLRRHAAAQPDGRLRVVTVLYRLPGETPTAVERVQVSDLVRTPVYVYCVGAAAAGGGDGEGAVVEAGEAGAAGGVEGRVLRAHEAASSSAAMGQGAQPSPVAAAAGEK
jgi:precorrin-6B methylase 2